LRRWAECAWRRPVVQLALLLREALLCGRKPVQALAVWFVFAGFAFNGAVDQVELFAHARSAGEDVGIDRGRIRWWQAWEFGIFGAVNSVAIRLLSGEGSAFSDANSGKVTGCLRGK
jgi:hypothetical protein